MEENKNTQRSRAWFEKRHKRWTASTISKLMSEGGLLPKNAGGNGELRYKWGGAAKTALFDKFYQRLTNIMEREIDPTPAMQRGLDLEPLAIERFAELYPQYTCIPSEDLVDTGFILFPDDDGTREWEKGYKGENSSAGTSPDQLLFNYNEESFIDGEFHFVSREKTVLLSGIETKARGESASNSHAYSVFDESHEDFWQVMAQMNSLGVKYWYYLNFDDEKPSDWALDVKRIERSDLHIKKMCKKIKDADKLIDGWLERCKGIESIMPDAKGILLTEIREEIQNLKEVW